MQAAYGHRRAMELWMTSSVHTAAMRMYSATVSRVTGDGTIIVEWDDILAAASGVRNSTLPAHMVSKAGTPCHVDAQARGAASLGCDFESGSCGWKSNSNSKLSGGARWDSTTAATLSAGAMGGRPAAEYALQVVRPAAVSRASYSQVMVAECRRYGMRPVCDRASTCDEHGLHIGGSSSVLSDPTARANAKHFPSGFAKVRSLWDGLCNYAGARGKALCNIPSLSTSWKANTKQANPGFVCGSQVFGGTCANGVLAPQISRTRENQCASCFSGFFMSALGTCVASECYTDAVHAADYRGE